QGEEGRNGYRRIPEIDPLTKCYGTFIHLRNSINISLPERKSVNIRIFGIYPKDVENLYFDDKKFLQQECVQDSMFCLPPILKSGKNFDGKIEDSLQTVSDIEQDYLEPNGAKSGFTYLNRYRDVNVIRLNIGQITNNLDFNLGRGCIKFIELIISDVTAKDLQEIEDLKLQMKEKSAKLRKMDKIGNLTDDQINEYNEISLELRQLKANRQQGYFSDRKFFNNNKMSKPSEEEEQEEGKGYTEKMMIDQDLIDIDELEEDEEGEDRHDVDFEDNYYDQEEEEEEFISPFIQGQKEINTLLPNSLLINCFYYVVMDGNGGREGIKFNQWCSDNIDRVTIQLVCKHWCSVLRTTCRSLSITKTNIKHMTLLSTSFAHLNELEILGGDYNDRVTTYICDILSTPHPTLKSIDMSMVNLDQDNMKEISLALSSNQCKIQSLNLESNSFGDEGIKYLIDSIESNTSLTNLDLQCCESYNGLEYIGKLISKNKTIKNLDWSYNESSYSCVINLSDGLRVNNTIEKLSLRGCHVEGWGALSIGDTLKINQSLKTLDLSENEFGDRGIINIARQLPFNQSLESLDVSCNLISTEGFDSLLESLTLNKTLFILDFSRNALDNSIALHNLQNSIQHCFLKSLYLSECNLIDLHLESISLGLCKNKTIINLDLSKNHFTSVSPLLSLIMHNSTLKSLNLSKHKFIIDDFKLLVHYLLKIDLRLENQPTTDDKTNLIGLDKVQHNLCFINLSTGSLLNSNLLSFIHTSLKQYKKSFHNTTNINNNNNHNRISTKKDLLKIKV
ncbi:hypothetical protein CYY_006479, partial [Polysphondylium violaceum]